MADKPALERALESESRDEAVVTAREAREAAERAIRRRHAKGRRGRWRTERAWRR